VIPPGSHIATSRINFRLLAREAQARNRKLSVIAPDAASRSIAGSAGLDVHASVAAFESALAAPPPPPGEAEPSTGAGAVTAAAAMAAATTATALEAPAPATPAPPMEPLVEPLAAPLTAPPPARPVAPTTRAGTIIAPVGRRRRRGLVIGSLATIGVLLVAGIGAAVYLPSAEITISPRPEPIGPVELSVSADPVATTVDTAGGIVPATPVDFPVSVSDAFAATGKRVEEKRATGTVTFDSVNTVGPVAVPSGTRVSTLGGIVFATTKAVTVPKAAVAGTTIKHGTINVAVRATKAGPDGNVEAGEITQVPDFLSTQQVSANNAKATTGGSREEFSQVTEKDVEAAVEALEVRVTQEFAAQIAAEEGVPTGQTLFPATADLGPISYEPRPAGLVGDEVETFELTATATGSATAVDVGQVEDVAQARLGDRVAAGASLVPGSVEVVIGDPTATGSVVSFPVTASASQKRPLDADALRAEVMGLPVDEAEALLERSGEVTISLWPGFITSIPTIDSRVVLTVVDGVTPSVAPSSVPS
jgi:hypothetical protein